MRKAWLLVCALAAATPRELAAQRQFGVAFDPRPVSLPQSDSGPMRPVTSRDLLTLREAHGLSISPDGKWIAFVVGQAEYETNSYRTGLFVVQTSGAAPPICLGSAGTPHWTSINEWETERPEWTKDSHNIFFRMRMSPRERWQVWTWNLEGGEGKPVTHVDGSVVRYELDSSGRKLVLKVEIPLTLEQQSELVEHGILFDKTMRPWEGIGPLLSSLVQAKSREEIWVKELDTKLERKATDAEKQRFEADIKEFQQRFDSASPAAGRCEMESLSWAPDRRHATAVCKFDEKDRSGLIRWRMLLIAADGQSIAELAPESTHVTESWWSDDSRSLYFVSSRGDGHPGKMRAMDTESGRVREFYQSEEVLRDFSMDARGQWIACTRETNTSPVRIAVLDQSGGSLRSLVDLNPEFRHLELSAAERISGVNSYGEEWFGHLVKPRGYERGKRYPLIVTLYRSGDYFLLGATGNEYPIQVFAAHGLAVLSFDIGRHRLRRAGDFKDYMIDWDSPQESLEMAVESLVKTGLVDPGRVGLAGLSHGAEIVEYAISHSRTFHAAIESGPAARDPYFYYMGGGKWHELFALWGLGGWPEGPSKENWQKLAASLNAERIDAPLLMNSADSEFSACLSLYTSLEQEQKPVELHIYTDELHIKNQPKHRSEIYERNVDWFRFWLSGEEDVSTVKREQYARWERLRRASSGVKETEAKDGFIQ